MIDPKEFIEQKIQAKERSVMLVHDVFTLGEGPQVLEILGAMVDHQVPKPSVTNPNENLWYVEGQRALLRWIQHRILVGQQIKEGRSPYRIPDGPAGGQAADFSGG